MKICSKKDLKAMTGILAATMLLGGCSITGNVNKSTNVIKGDPDLKTEINLNEVSETKFDKNQMDQKYRRYCLDIFSRTVKDYGTDENVMISPASIMMALDMVAAGAKGETLKQLTDLFAEGQGPLEQQAYASALMDRINESENVEFSCANAVWSNKTLLGDSVNLEYIDYIQDTFKAEYNVSEFNSKTPAEINSWVDKHTDHMIKEVIRSLEPSTVMVLVNAISFDGKWADPYEEDQVRSGDFRTSDGKTVSVDFLHGTETAYYETEKATGFLKYYKGGEYAFLAILPTDENISANEFVKNFTAEDYEKFIESENKEYEVITKLPKFNSDFEFTMNDTLENLGASDAFHAETADLSGIAGTKGDLYISKVIHKTHIEVDADGTKAAAVTAVTLDAGSCIEFEQEFRYVECDRPFAYAIVDTTTMAPVFIGTVNAV